MSPASAQEEQLGTSFLTPFPANDVYQVEVLGDSLAEGLIYGLVEAFEGDARVQLNRKVRSVPGLMRASFDEEMKPLEQAGTETVHASIVMVGAWDRVGPKGENGRRMIVGSPEWRAEYARRVDRLMRGLRKRNSAVYWVGQPPMRKPNADEGARMMNEIVRERAYLNGQKFIDAYAGFADESGGYNAYGPDLKGKSVLLREGDGIHFTGTGNRKLAHFVERELKRDLTQSKGERAIPLAGNEAEQARISASKGAETKPDGAGEKSRPAAAPSQTANPWTPSPEAVAQSGGEQKPDNSRVSIAVTGAKGEETVTLDILRPAISASIVALVTRRESPDKPSQVGDAVVDRIPGGLTLMSTITPGGKSDAPGSRKVSPTQTPFFRVLVKGERLTPKTGRADDMAWPRPQPAAVDARAGRFSAPAAGLVERGRGRRDEE